MPVSWSRYLETIQTTDQADRHPMHDKHASRQGIFDGMIAHPSLRPRPNISIMVCLAPMLYTLQHEVK
jgi:hypothetical protein